jgi:alkanesulfonate monooxygenase SsuD/methylene tetrahydromethanopterin reductase-like flavin-dependent oxidoreductase (luciferase family)
MLPHPTTPFARGSVSLRIYPHNDLPATAIVEELLGQAAAAAEHGFDGVMTAEHHGGFAGYLPNPLQVAGWMLGEMVTGWAAACPLLLPLRPPAMVAEEVAWLAARFPGRVGVGVASGALRDDFDVMGVSMDGLPARFAEGLEAVTGYLSGRSPGALTNDPAIARCVDAPVPVVSAAMGFTAVRRAAATGAGLLFDSMSALERIRRLTDAYREAGGTGSCILIRRAWLGPAPADLVERQVEVYRSYSSDATQRHWDDGHLVTADHGDDVAARLADAVERAGADCLNLRIQVPGVGPDAARDQIARLGEEVLPPLRALLA